METGALSNVRKCCICLKLFSLDEKPLILPEVEVADVIAKVVVFCSVECKNVRINICQDLGLDPNSYSYYWSEDKFKAFIYRVKSHRKRMLHTVCI